MTNYIKYIIHYTIINYHARLELRKSLHLHVHRNRNESRLLSEYPSSLKLDRASSTATNNREPARFVPIVARNKETRFNGTRKYFGSFYSRSSKQRRPSAKGGQQELQNLGLRRFRCISPRFETSATVYLYISRRTPRKTCTPIDRLFDE